MRAEIVLGPPGTGKTTTLLRRVEEELAAGTAPEAVGYVSFTRRAADEAVTRACTKFGFTRSHLPYFRTLHSLCFRWLGTSSADILAGKKLEEFGDLVGYKITGRFSLEDGTVFGFEKGDRLLFMENLSRVRQTELRSVYDEDDDDLSFWEVDRFSRALRQYKIDAGLLDYTDLLQQFLSSDGSPRLEVLFVDEAQDLSLLQWAVIRKLARTCRRLVIAGDDDQAIYRWAGADVETLVAMEGDVSVLDQSWRVPRAVQAVASDVVSRISHRRTKVWRPRDDDGVVRRLAHVDLVDLSSGQILVLGRNRYILREYERQIRSAGYLYEFQGNASIRPSLLRAVLTWERLRRGREGVIADDARGMYEMMTMGRGWKRGYKTLPGFRDDEQVTMASLIERGGLLLTSPEMLWYDALDKMDLRDVAYIRAARRRGEDLLRPPRIRLSTIHGMKGGEAERVVLFTDMAARTHLEASRAPDDEARVWYVAVTRAREELNLIAPQTSRFYDL